MAIRYTQNVAIEQIPFFNLPGGGLLTGPTHSDSPTSFGFPVQFNDPGIEIGSVKNVTAIYQLQGNETVNDIINIYLAQPGSMIDPAYSSISCTAAATILTGTVGDDDVTGYGLVSSGVAFGVTPLTVTPKGASASRYSTAITLSGSPTNPVGFVGGTAFIDPYVIGTLAVEPVGGSPGTGISGSWIQFTISTISVQVAGTVLVFRLKVIKP